jgi:diguanylate cyclase (GGDEF)-like protein/PAS domain S-box-containing protein
VVFVEILVSVGLKPLGPLGWPALGLLVGTALWGASGALGGAVVLFAYYIWNLSEPQRFPHFFSSNESIVFWALGLAILASFAAVFRQRVVEAEAKAIEATRTQAELEAVRRYEERLRTITDNVPVLIGYVDAEQRFQFNNLAYETWYARPRPEITGRPVREVLGEAAYQKVRLHLERALGGGRVTFQVEYRINGESRHAQTTYLPDFDRAGRVRGVFVAAKDVGPLVAAQEELAAANRRLEQAMERPLAGVVDRAQLYERLRHGLTRARRSGGTLALLSIDVEQAGDAAQLAAAAGRLRACLRATDTLARVEGGAFMALLEGLKDRGDAFQAAEKMLRVVREAELTASIGIAFPGDEEAQPEALVQRADAALGQAKAAGRDAIRVSS